MGVMQVSQDIITTKLGANYGETSKETIKPSHVLTFLKRRVLFWTSISELARTLTFLGLPPRFEEGKGKKFQLMN